jgi:hypothetical protein
VVIVKFHGLTTDSIQYSRGHENYGCNLCLATLCEIPSDYSPNLIWQRVPLQTPLESSVHWENRVRDRGEEPSNTTVVTDSMLPLCVYILVAIQNQCTRGKDLHGFVS